MLRRLLLAVSALGLLALLFLDLQGLPARRLVHVAEDAAHGPLFGMLACIAMSLLRGARTPVAATIGGQYFLAAGICFALGLLTELGQGLGGRRDGSFDDFVNDVLGTLGGLALYALFDARVPRPAPLLRAALAAVAAGIVLLFTVPVLWAAAAYWHRSEQFPVLVDADSRLDLFFVAPLGTAIERTDAPAIRIVFRGQPWPGVMLIEPRGNWRRFSTLVVDLENPGDAPLPLGLRVNDRQHNHAYVDRFNREFQLAPRTRRELRVPLTVIESAPRGRRMDMGRIAGLALFRLRADAPQELFLYSIRLE